MTAACRYRMLRLCFDTTFCFCQEVTFSRCNEQYSAAVATVFTAMCNTSIGVRRRMIHALQDTNVAFLSISCHSWEGNTMHRPKLLRAFCITFSPDVRGNATP